MSVELVVDQVSQKETVTATETYSMSVELVADQVSQKETVTATETYSMSVELVADQVSQKETVTATETYSMSVELVADQVSQKETVTATETYSMSVDLWRIRYPRRRCDCDGNVLDECGTCGGSGIPEGDCDCDGNVLDECGTCGGSGIPAGDCDCDGNQLDALGVCGGDCTADNDGNGICDDAEMGGCMDATACNYDASATQDNGSCDYCSCLRAPVAYTLTVEASTPAVAPGTTYRFYVDMTDASDRLSAIFGNDQAPLEINTPDGAFNSSFNASWSASGINPAFLGFFPRDGR